MPNERAKDKKRMNLWLNRELYKKVERYAKTRGLTMTEVVVSHLAALTADVQLTAEEYEEIAREMRR